MAGQQKRELDEVQERGSAKRVRVAETADDRKLAALGVVFQAHQMHVLVRKEEEFRWGKEAWRLIERMDAVVNRILDTVGQEFSKWDEETLDGYTEEINDMTFYDLEKSMRYLKGEMKYMYNNKPTGFSALAVACRYKELWQMRKMFNAGGERGRLESLMNGIERCKIAASRLEQYGYFEKGVADRLDPHVREAKDIDFEIQALMKKWRW